MIESPTVHYFRPAGLSGLELLTCPDGDFLFPPHVHADYCIWLNCSGGEYYTHRGNSHILQPDSVGIIAPGEVHANQACDRTARSLITFYLDPQKLQEVGGQVGDSAAIRTEFATATYRDPEVLRRLICLQSLLAHSPSSLERESAFLETISLLITRHGIDRLSQRRVGEEPSRVAQIIELFHAHLGEDVGLDGLASCFDCTPYYLIRFFKKATGLSPHAYLVQLRLEKARQLLAEGESIVDVAFDTGFSDQSHLTRSFKSRFGIPPGSYQKQIKNS